MWRNCTASTLQFTMKTLRDMIEFVLFTDVSDKQKFVFVVITVLPPFPAFVNLVGRKLS